MNLGTMDPNGLLRRSLGLNDGETPFPWQSELLARLQRGEIPTALDVPTGLGKTSVMAIWLTARACGAKLPRRLVYVVDRRTVVDQATQVALELKKLVEADQTLKKQLGLGADQPLPISTLRGRYVDNRDWLENPAAPAIIVGTADMVGSRLLFAGYGVSRKMRPYHAGLLGADALVVLDEAHLVPPFEHLLRAVEKEPAEPPVPRFRLLTLSATGRTRCKDVVGLTENDFAHHIVTKRLNAKKSLRMELLDEKTTLEDALAIRSWTLTDAGKKAVRVLVYTDSREVAQKTKAAVEKLAKGDAAAGKPAVEVETELLVGSRRVFERERAQERLRTLGFIAGSKVDRSRPAFLFATSAGEVGVDLDADCMVCDLVAWERMVQRLGRVNRRGDAEANVIVLVEPKPRPNKQEQEALDKRARNEGLDDKEHERVEKYERKVLTWEYRQKPFERLRKNHDGTYDASLRALLDLKTRASTDEELRRIVDDATTPEPLRPALTRPLVEAWAMTSLEEHPGRPAIQPWLRGWVESDPPQTAVVWRSHLPVRTHGTPPTKEEIEAFFEAAPPHASELLESETFRVAKWIAARAKSVRKEKAQTQRATESAENPLREQDVVAFALEPDGRLRKSLTLAEIEAPEGEEGTPKLDDLLAGCTLVVDARLGGLDDGLLVPDGSAVPRTADDGQPWLFLGAVGFRVRRVEAATAITKDSDWRERLRFALEVTQEGEPTRWLIVEKWRNDAATEEDRSIENPQLLDEHQAWTEDRVRELATALGLGEHYEKLLALAARLHDEGKRAARWQRAFHAPADGVYAKTEGPINYRLLDGYRHELGSLLRVESDERIQKFRDEDRDLLLHLIVAHHGFARPVISTSGCDDRPPSVLEEKVGEIARRFARLQGRWGPWGLAWWEALLRAADLKASRDNAARNTAGGIA